MINLNDYGYTPFFQTQVSKEHLLPARVTGVHRERYIIITQYGESGARLKGSVYYQGNQEVQYPTTGDFVSIEYNSNGDSIIYETLNRKSCFERSDDFSSRGVQTVAANFDYVFIMASLNCDFNVKRIQRYLTLAWQSGGVPVIVLTKADLSSNFDAQMRDVQRISSDVDVIAVSAKTGLGIDRLSDYLNKTKTLVFLGSSGVGKSSLVNALAGEDIMAVNEIREDDSKGKHTTTHRQLIMLKSGVMIIDTPGMRELGMWDVSIGLGETFSDIESLVAMCKFSNCTHTNEPHCGVLAAIENGTLEASRWEYYLQLKQEAKFTGDKMGYLKDKEQWQKEISKFQKRNKNAGRIRR